jgi:hypothetical protein
VQEQTAAGGDRSTEAAVAAAMEGPYMRLAIGVSTAIFQKNSISGSFFWGTGFFKSDHAENSRTP